MSTAYTRLLINSGLLDNLREVVKNIECEIGENVFEYSVVNRDEVRDLLLGKMKYFLLEREYNEIIDEDLEMFQLFNVFDYVYTLEENNPKWKIEIYKDYMSVMLFQELGKILAQDGALLHEFVEELLEYHEDNDKLGLPF